MWVLAGVGWASLDNAFPPGVVTVGGMLLGVPAHGGGSGECSRSFSGHPAAVLAGAGEWEGPPTHTCGLLAFPEAVGL